MIEIKTPELIRGTSDLFPYSEEFEKELEETVKKGITKALGPHKAIGEISEAMDENLSPIPPRDPFNSDKKLPPHSKKETATTNRTKSDGYKPLMMKNQKHCIKDNESYVFLIAWSILNYFIILIFAVLLMSWFDINKRSNQIRRNVLEIIR